MKRSTLSKLLLIGLSAATLVGCASSGLSTSGGGKVRSAKYNTEIEHQGLAHYCANSTCDSPPKLIVGKAPVYPPQALSRGESGEAAVTFVVGLDGSTSQVELISASAPEFGAAAILAVKQWRFEPARLNGEPVKLQLEQHFPFTP